MRRASSAKRGPTSCVFFNSSATASTKRAVAALPCTAGSVRLVDRRGSWGHTRRECVRPWRSRQPHHFGIAADRAIEQAALALRAVVVLGGEPAFEGVADGAAQVE